MVAFSIPGAGAGRDCNLAADDAQRLFAAYAIPLGRHAQLIMLDLAIAGNKPMTAADPEFEQFARSTANMPG